MLQEIQEMGRKEEELRLYIKNIALKEAEEQKKRNRKRIEELERLKRAGGRFA